jgi:hypothetical protein
MVAGACSDLGIKDILLQTQADELNVRITTLLSQFRFTNYVMVALIIASLLSTQMWLPRESIVLNGKGTAGGVRARRRWKLGIPVDRRGTKDYPSSV